MKETLRFWRTCFFVSLLSIAFVQIPFLSHSQTTKLVTGIINDDAGKPVEGASVAQKGTATRTVTKADGSFSITVPTNAVLVISSVGFANQEVSIATRTSFTIALVRTTNDLDEVVVVGYGTQRKSDVTGALSRVTEEVIRERPAQNVLQAIQGKAAGVNVSSNFKPGELPVLRIRGNRSIGASNDPLYVVDGIPLVNSLGVNSFNVSDINPNDIVSVEILKDASSTAIYGSRGANGVVLISTRKGQKGRMSVGYNATISVDSYKSLTDWMDGGQYIDRWRETLINGRLYQTTTNTNLNQQASSWYPDPFLDRDKMGLATDGTALASVWAGYDWTTYGVTVKTRATTAAEQAMGWPAQVPVYNAGNIRSYDWLDAATRSGITQNHQISLATGNDMSRLAISLNYYNQKGVQRDQDYTRYTANISGDAALTNWFTLGTSIIASYSEQDFGINGPNTSNTGAKDLYSRAADQFPYALPVDANGFAVRNPGGNLSLWNPLIDIDQALNNRKSTSILASTFAEIKFADWIKYRVNFGVQYRQFRNGTWTGPDATSHLTNRPSTAGYANDLNFSWVVENLLYINKRFGTAHNLNVTLLQSAQKSSRENTGMSVTGTINPLSLWYDLGSNTAGNPGYGTGFTENSLASFMARVNYTFLDRYLLTATMRADGSSVLAPEHKWDYFPSVSVAWKMQEEKFMNGITWVNELKPRVSYGITGNSAVNPYTTSGPLSRNPYVFGSVAGIGYLPQLVQNPDLGWEKTAQLNMGLDFGLLKNRVTGTLEVYTQNTSDLIFARSLPAVSGYVQKFENIGKTKNSGIELTVTTINIQKPNFTWSTDFNWSNNKEEIVELVAGKTDMLADRLFIGQPTQVFYNYANAGIWGNDSKSLADMAAFNTNGHRFYPGTVKVVDQNADNRITAADMVILGTPRPKWTGGITNNFRYKNWSLNAFVYFRWGQTYFGGYPNSYGGVNPNGRVENDVWGWQNQGGRWPMPNGGNVENITASMQYNNGSFAAVRNISLSYEFPKKWIDKVGIKDLVFNAQVINPFIFGPSNGVRKMGINPDDETNWAIASSNTNPLGGTNNNTILPQSFVFGLRAGF
jgi:TonB-linked SusC/RagA family outer membrane protein